MSHNISSNEERVKKDRARYACRQAVKKGKIPTSDHCELCEHNKKARVRKKLAAHHWRGYDYPLDVWWICYRCNAKLADYHDGSLTIEQARKFIADWRPTYQRRIAALPEEKQLVRRIGLLLENGCEIYLRPTSRSNITVEAVIVSGDNVYIDRGQYFRRAMINAITKMDDEEGQWTNSR